MVHSGSISPAQLTETEFGAQLSWQRLDDKRASRISFTVPGGWMDDTTPGWRARAISSTVDQAVNAHAALVRDPLPACSSC